MEIQGLNLNNKFILEESQNVLLGASETVAYTISILLVLMGIYPDIQVGNFVKKNLNKKWFIAGKTL